MDNVEDLWNKYYVELSDLEIYQDDLEHVNLLEFKLILALCKIQRALRKHKLI